MYRCNTLWYSLGFNQKVLSGVWVTYLVHFIFRDLKGDTQIHQSVALSFCFGPYSQWKLISLLPDGQKWKKSRSNFWGTLNSLRKITIVLERRLSEASWQQIAGESLKKTVFILKTMFFGGVGCRGESERRAYCHQLQKNRFIGKKNPTSPTFRERMCVCVCILKCTVHKERSCMCWDCRRTKNRKIQCCLNTKCTHFLCSLFLSINLDSLLTKMKQK